MKKHKFAAFIFGVLALGWAGLLFYFSGQNGTDSTSISMKVARLLVEWFPGIIGMSAEAFNPILRKIAHFGIFAVEGVFTGLCLMNALPMGKGLLLSCGICILMAGANEYHQTFIEGRAGQLRDVFIDSAGALTGVFAAAALMAVCGMILIRHNNKSTSIYRTGD